MPSKGFIIEDDAPEPERKGEPRQRYGGEATHLGNALGAKRHPGMKIRIATFENKGTAIKARKRLRARLDVVEPDLECWTAPPPGVAGWGLYVRYLPRELRIAGS